MFVSNQPSHSRVDVTRGKARDPYPSLTEWNVCRTTGDGLVPREVQESSQKHGSTSGTGVWDVGGPDPTQRRGTTTLTTERGGMVPREAVLTV